MKFLVYVGALLVSSLAQARWLTPKEASSICDKYTVDCDVAKNGAWSQTIEYVAVVQAEDAKTALSLFNIEYNSFTDKVEVLEAFTMNGKDKISVEKTAIEDRDKGESKEYDAVKVRSVVFPQVQIGSRIHLRYKVTTSVPQMENRWSNDIMLAPGVFIEKMQFTVKSELPLFYELSDPQSLVRVEQPDRFHLKILNRKALHGWVQGEKEPYFHPQNATHIYISSNKDWAEFFKTVDKDFSEVLSAPMPKALGGVVAKARNLKTAKEQIYSLMEFMSRKFRYFGDWRRLKGGIVPRTLAEIEKSRYGDCKDLSSLLTSMLRALKIEANVALIRRGENPWGREPDYNLPEMNRFNHAIVEAKVGEDVYWLDATNPVSSVEPFPDIAGRPAWILQPGHGHFARTPESTSHQFEHVHNYEYRFPSLDTVKLRVDAHLRHLAPYHIATSLMLDPRAQVLTDTMEYFSEGQEVHAFKFLQEPETTRALGDMNISLEFDEGRATFKAGKAAFFVIPDGFLGGPFYETTGRESDLRLSTEPFYFRGTRRLKDTRLAQALPPACKVESPWVDMEREITVADNDVVIKQNIDLKKPFITHEDYATKAFRDLQEGTKKCFYRSGILVESLKGTL